MADKAEAPDEGEAMAALVAGIIAVDRRIDNMRYLLGFQEAKRARTVAAAHALRGEGPLRTLTPDPTPAADVADGCCTLCGRKAPRKGFGAWMRLWWTGAGTLIVHVEDATLIDVGVVAAPEAGTDMGTHPVCGPCARRAGPEYAKNE